MSGTPTTPYADSAEAYWRAGWTGVLPLPLGKKASPPVGYTGNGAPYLSYANMYALVTGPEGGGNVCLRLPDGVIGLDVDAYDGKPGEASLKALVARCGELPPTWLSTSRGTAEPSGIRCYRVPAGIAWKGNPVPGIEIIQSGHRYAVVWPSIHPEGRTYRWVAPDGAISDSFPKPGELPELPAAWIAELTATRERVRAAELTYGEASAWLAACRPGPLCGVVAGTLGKYIRLLAEVDGRSRHDLALDGTRALVAFGGEGHGGASDAVQQLGSGFLSAATDAGRPGAVRDEVEAIKEYTSLVAGAVRLAAARDAAPRQDCECGSDFLGEATGSALAGEPSSVVKPVDPPTPQSGRRARVTWASDIEPEPVVWAWKEGGHGRIPAGSLSAAAGREGTGKSSFGIWLAARITTGTLPGAFFGQPRQVLYVAVEDSWAHTIVPRLIAAGADRSMVGRFDVVIDEDGEVTLSLPVDNALLENAITAHKVALIVIDPLMSVISERVDTHRERDVRTALDPLSKLSTRTGAVVLGIAHFNKGSGTDAASLITGSGAFKNVPRSIFGFAKDGAEDGGGRIMTQVKNSLGPCDELPSLGYVIEKADIDTSKGVAETSRFRFTGESARSVHDVLRDARSNLDDDDRAERADAADWLAAYLVDNGGEAEAVAVLKAGSANGFSRDVLKRAKKKAGVSSRKGSMEAGWIWFLDLAEGSEGREGSEERSLPESAPFGAPFGEGAGTEDRPAEGSRSEHRSGDMLPSLPSLPSRSSGDDPPQSPAIKSPTVLNGEVAPAIVDAAFDDLAHIARSMI